MLYFDSIAVGAVFLGFVEGKDQHEISHDENLFAGPSVA